MKYDLGIGYKDSSGIVLNKVDLNEKFTAAE